eukprot:jgi/Bigna1/90793/estExt_fgenesh1_pg.C_790076
MKQPLFVALASLAIALSVGTVLGALFLLFRRRLISTKYRAALYALAFGIVIILTAIVRMATSALIPNIFISSCAAAICLLASMNMFGSIVLQFRRSSSSTTPTRIILNFIGLSCITAGSALICIYKTSRWNALRIGGPVLIILFQTVATALKIRSIKKRYETVQTHLSGAALPSNLSGAALPSNPSKGLHLSDTKNSIHDKPTSSTRIHVTASKGRRPSDIILYLNQLFMVNVAVAIVLSVIFGFYFTRQIRSSEDPRASLNGLGGFLAIVAGATPGYVFLNHAWSTSPSNSDT